MRYLLIVCCLFVGMRAANAQSAPVPATAWQASLPAALAQAQATQRPVLAVFSGSDWCRPCMMLQQEVFDQAEFLAFAQDRLVLARFDFPRNHKNQLPAAQTKLNEQAAAQLNAGGEFPLVVLLSPEGKVLARSGYRAGGPSAYEAYLQPFLAKK